MTRILIVEDEPDIALGLEEDLKRQGYDVETVGDGESAVRRASRETWDVILLDVMLPRRDGFEVCRELRRARVKTPIILLTAKTQEAEKILIRSPLNGRRTANICCMGSLDLRRLCGPCPFQKAKCEAPQ